MKKTIICVVALLALASCHKPTQEELKRDKSEWAKQYFRTIEYKGHSYILFEYNVAQYSKGGLTHDPDCKKCKGNYDKE